MQKSSDEPFRNSLQPLVWSIGSVSGTMNEEQERRLLVATIMDLLRLIQMKSNKDDKVIIAGCLMYVIQQYPRFLKQYYVLLRTVIRKNFDFMHETHPGVQDMACDTFLKLARNCGSQLIIPHQTDKGRFPPFIEEVLPNVPVYTELLSTQQVEVFFSAVATIAKFQRNADTRNQWIGALLLPFNQEMQRVIREGVQSPAQFHTPANLLAIRRALRINRVVCEVLQMDFATQVSEAGRAEAQLLTFFQDFCDLFQLYGQAATATLRAKGAAAVNYQDTHHQLLIKREIVRMLQAFVAAYKPKDVGCGAQVNIEELCERFVPLLLKDFQDTPDCAKEPLELLFLSTLIETLKVGAAGSDDAQDRCKGLIPDILSAVFMPSLQLITKDRLQYTDLMLAFYKLMENLARFAFTSLFAFPEPEQKLLIDSLIWGFKDSDRKIYETALETVLLVLEAVRASENSFRQSFYRSFLVYLIENVLWESGRGDEVATA